MRLGLGATEQYPFHGLNLGNGIGERCFRYEEVPSIVIRSSE